MRQQALKRKELFILIGIVLGFVIILSTAGLYFRGNKSESNGPKDERTYVEGTLPDNHSPENKKSGKESERIGSEAFFLTPGASEVLAALRDADPHSDPKTIDEMPPMKVMWPGYFFSIDTGDENKARVQLDVDENGFGVILICSISRDDYPEIMDLASGQKIWVAGQVTEVDMEGTGSVYIDVDYVRFDEEGPAAASKLSPADESER